MATFETIHTNYGLARIAAAAAAGSSINLLFMAVGDGNGQPVTPSPAQVSLVREVYRAPINEIRQSTLDPAQYRVEMVIPASVGGWVIREFGVIDDQGQFFSLGNFPATYKPTAAEGAVADLVIRAVLVVSNAGVINISIDPNVAVASRQWVINNINAAALLPGGTTGQVLTKQSNADGDADWQDPDALSLLVDAIEEPEVVLASGQQTVNLAETNTTGLAVYIEGVRIFRGPGVDGWQQGTGPTQVVLGKAYPVGSRFRAVQNEPASNIPDPLTASQNLADVVSVSAARNNLDVYSRAEVDARMPAGTIAYTARSTAPPGWLLCDGALVAQSLYPALFAAIGNAYWVGGGSPPAGQFRLPELRGEFIRVLDSGRGVDTGRAIGSPQAPMVQQHKHMTQWGEAGGGTTFGRSAVSGKQGSNATDGDNFWFHTNDGSNFDGIVNPDGTIGAETRPRNIALPAIIKT